MQSPEMTDIFVDGYFAQDNPFIAAVAPIASVLNASTASECPQPAAPLVAAQTFYASDPVISTCQASES
jgi:hypothetical protein